MRESGAEERCDSRITDSHIPAPTPDSRATILGPPSAPQAQSFDQGLITRGVGPLEVVEQAASLAHQLQQPAPGMVIFHVGLEVLGELADALREDGDLDLGRASAIVRPELETSSCQLP
jgi:hypothetical protein